jgi:hypothetical protein
MFFGVYVDDMNVSLCTPRKMDRSSVSLNLTLRAIQPSPEKKFKSAVAQISPSTKLESSLQPPHSRHVERLSFPLVRDESGQFIYENRSSRLTCSGPASHAQPHLVQEPVNILTSSKIIAFEEFTLIEEDGFPRMARTKEEWDALWKLFPGAYGIGFSHYLLIVRYKTMPAKPWPLAVAGLLLYITDEHDTIGFPHKLGIPPNPQTRHRFRHDPLEGEDTRIGASEVLFDRAIRYFENDLDVRLLSIVNFLGWWLITVPDHTDMTRLPSIMSKSLCRYIKISDQQMPREAAVRVMQPHGTNWDSSAYDILRPGIMVGCGATSSEHELLTTAGIEVKDKHGSRYVTVADHGFPVSREIVFHPNADGASIGRVVHRIKDSGIALMKLNPGQQFDNKTFDSELQEAFGLSNVPGLQVRGIREAHSLRYGDVVSLNSPFSGFREAIHVATEKSRIRSDGDVDEHVWTTQNWQYFGSDEKEMRDGSCGSVILDDDGNACSFFRYVISAQPGFGVSIAASTLLAHGFTL